MSETLAPLSPPLTGVSNRQHSPEAIQAAKSWQACAERSQASPASDRLSELLQMVRSVAAEATYMGFPKASQLCRVLHAALVKQHNVGQPLSAEQLTVLSTCFTGLAVLVESPHEVAVDTTTLTQKLRLAFDLTEGEVSTPVVGLKMPNGPAFSSSDMAKHRDLDVYLSARLDSLDRCLEEETWIVAQLAALAEDLASGQQSQHPAQRLMRVLRSHKFFHQVDRVCLAGRVPNANQLMIVDASSSDRCQPSPMKPGYSCFVNPEGSLFSLRPGTLRIFDDSDRVLGTFAASGRPAQRSIALIDGMGLKSGLCLAIGRDSDLQGFLFLNSCQPELFRDITVNFAPLISLLGLVATIALDSNGFHKYCGKFGQLDGDLPHTSVLFDLAEFKVFVERAIVRRIGPNMPFQLSIQGAPILDDFLYLPAQVAGVLGELILRLQSITPGSTALKLSIQQADAMVSVSVPHRASRTNTKQWEWLRWQIDYLTQFIGNTPLTLTVGEDDVSVGFPWEPVLHSHRDIRYSVVY